MLYILLLLLFLIIIIIIILPVVLIYKQYQIKLMLSYEGAKKSFNEIHLKIFIKDEYYKCWYSAYRYTNIIKNKLHISRNDCKYISMYKYYTALIRSNDKYKKHKTYSKLINIMKNKYNISEV